MAKTPTGKRRGRPVGSKNRATAEAANDTAPANPTPREPTFAERLEAFAASKPAPADITAAAKWYAENMDACLKAREEHPNVTYREMYEIARQSGLPPEVTLSQFQSRVSVAASKKQKQRMFAEQREKWRAQREAEDAVRLDSALREEIANARDAALIEKERAAAKPWPPIQVTPNSEWEKGMRKLDPSLDTEIRKARGEKDAAE